MNIKISIADDHPLVIKGLKGILPSSKHIELIDTYGDGIELLEGLEKTVPDVLLLDIQLPGKQGDELVPIILKKYPDLKIIILTNFDSALYAHNLFKLGICGYLLKNVDDTVILDAIETVYGGKQFLENSMREKMQQLSQKAVKMLTSKSALTPREKDVLQLIVNGDSTQEIAEKLFLSMRTVENYRLNIQLKLDVKNTAMLVNKALKTGLAK